jgi:hypothetical protein
MRVRGAHPGVHTRRACLIAGTADHPIHHGERQAVQTRVVPPLHGDEERVDVDVEQRWVGHVSFLMVDS